MLEAAEDVFRLAQEYATGVGQRHVMPAPFEKRDADLCFQLADLLTERRLRGMEPRGGAREVELVGHRHEVPEMTQFHCNRLDAGAGNGKREHGPVSRPTSHERTRKVSPSGCPSP